VVTRFFRLDNYRDLGKALGPLPEHLTLRMDADYDYRCVYEDLAGRQITAQIAKLRRCTERRRICVEFFIALTAAVVTICNLIRRAQDC
jgi:hypothetical protein